MNWEWVDSWGNNLAYTPLQMLSIDVFNTKASATVAGKIAKEEIVAYHNGTIVVFLEIGHEHYNYLEKYTG